MRSVLFNVESRASSEATTKPYCGKHIITTKIHGTSFTISKCRRVSQMVVAFNRVSQEKNGPHISQGVAKSLDKI